MEVAPISAPHQARRHLQRLIRKVKHVLIVKRYIDDLKGGIGLRQCRGALLQTTDDVLKELPSEPATLTRLSKLNAAAHGLDSKVKVTQALLPNGGQPPRSIDDELQEILAPRASLQSLEKQLDTFITRTSENLHSLKQSIVNVSRNFWISCSRKRVASVHDPRSKALLIKLLQKEDDGVEQLIVLQRYLDKYIAGSFGRPLESFGRALESLSEVVSRLRAVFGIGWFFEWPSGRHPLNSTWPWADVKPSLLVLWGVCWMFFPTHYGDCPIPQRPQYHPIEYQSQLNDYSNSVQYEPDQFGHSPLPQLFRNAPYNPTSLPRGYLATSQVPALTRQTQPSMQGTMISMAQESIGQGSDGISDFETSSHLLVGPGAAEIRSPPYLHNSWNLQVGSAPNQIFGGVGNLGLRTRNVAERQVWLNTPTQLLREPEGLGENPALFRAATPPFFNPHQYLPQYNTASSASAPMPSTTAFSSYPPLDNMNEMHDPRAPYMVEQERAYNQISEPHSYDHHHDSQQDQPRYPTPPPPPSENPYNAQGAAGQTPDSRMEMPMEPKSESDAPSPGRTQPIMKPRREITKDANGRFYCNWAGCTEEIKDFGRKCEWSKHMDKHDRPYKCPSEGCEKLPGFTYSGGLLRHEREVHNKHGGPRKQLNCPHPNCKRHTGKGFSRQENLNEHLRRVHTDTGLPPNGEETEDDVNEAQSGGKRKRTRGDSADLREEMKRLKQENEELKRQAEAQTAQSAEMMRQIMQLQQTQQLQASMHHPRMQAPAAQMT